MEAQEYTDRVKTYSQRLGQQWSNVRHPGTGPKGLLQDLPNPEQILNANPISTADLQTVLFSSMRFFLVFVALLSKLFQSFVDEVFGPEGGPCCERHQGGPQGGPRRAVPNHLVND